MNITKCKGCNAPIAFVKDRVGKTHPLDVRTPIYEVKRDLAGNEVCEIVTEGFYVSHFKTCPQANRFSASGRSS